MDDNKARTTRPAPARKRRRAWKWLAITSLLAIGLVAGLPWLLGTPPARAWLVGRINARLAPGSVELEGLGLSWLGPIEITGVNLRDPRGKTVLAARRVGLDRGALGLLASRPDYGTITIEGATVDVERRADGSIDVLEALGLGAKPEEAPTSPAPAPAPEAAPVISKMAVRVVIKGGTLRVAAPELAEPIVSKGLDGSIAIAPGKPMEVLATLVDEGRSLDVRGSIDRASAGDRALTVVAKGWPIHVRSGGVEALGRVEGTLEARQEHGLWAIKGDPSIVGVEAIGPSLQGDRLALDRVSTACDLDQSSTGWTIRKFEVTSPVAVLSANGLVPAVEGTPARLHGHVDLAALAKMLPNAMRLRDGLALARGSAVFRLDVSTVGTDQRADVIASLEDFEAIEAGRRVALREPARLTGSATRSKENKVTVERLEVKAAGVDLTAGGNLEEGVNLKGTVDLVALMAQLRDVLDLGTFGLSGHARLAADYRRLGDSYKAGSRPIARA